MAGFDRAATPERLLGWIGGLWFVTATFGLLAFVHFVAAYYGSRTLRGDFAAWNDKPLIDGYVAGDAAGNAVFAAHVLPAAVMTLSGILQLLPQLRRVPALHRWNGRLFLTLACFLALSGLYLVWVRGTYLSLISGISVSLNGVLILAFAALAWRFAAARRFDLHRRWAMRTFMVANGVWFFRVGLMAWVILNQGPVGMSEDLSGPADIAIQFGSYLLPLAALEAWFLARTGTRAATKLVVGVSVVAAVLVMVVGIFGTVALMWGPYL